MLSISLYLAYRLEQLPGLLLAMAFYFTTTKYYAKYWMVVRKVRKQTKFKGGALYFSSLLMKAKELFYHNV